MKNLFLACLIALSSVLLFSCSNEKENQTFDLDQNNISSEFLQRNTSLIVDHDEVMDFDSEFENASGIFNLSLDSEREVYIDVSESIVYIPINPGYTASQTSESSKGPKIKEVHGGIKFTIARKNPREDPNKCQDDCKCGVGFRCGSTKSVTIKMEHRTNFNSIDREVVAKQYIDIENNYYMLEFVTIMDWNKLQDE